MTKPLVFNNRQDLHDELDAIIDQAEKRGFKLALLAAHTLEMRARPATKKIPGTFRFKLSTGIAATSFKPELRDHVNHLAKDPDGRMNLFVNILMGFPANTLSDYDEVIAEVDTPAQEVTP